MKANTLSILIPFAMFLAGCPKNASAPEPATPAAEASSPEAASPAPAENPNLVRGRQFATWFAAKDFQAIFDNTAPQIQEALPLTAWPSAHAHFEKLYGSEVSVEEEAVVDQGPFIVYRRTATWEKSDTVKDGELKGAQSITLLTQIALSPDGLLGGFTIAPPATPAPSEFLDYQTKTTLQLPLTGEWMVFWGGRTVEENYHSVDPGQRFAMDLLVVTEGKSFKTDGKSNEDYYAFGKPVVAPGAGVVVGAENTVHDNIPGEMNPKQVMGNYVIIDHQNGEFSFLAHFKQGTVAVKKGDTVTAGQALGECGNSGNSSEAHIHYHLQNTAKLGGGAGLPVQFQNYHVNGEVVERGEVTQGQIISPK